MRTFSKRTAVLAASSAAVVATAGIAYAWYSANVVGTGSGTATPAANTASAVTWAADPISGLVPGGSAVNQTLTFTNPNDYSVGYTAKSITISSVTGPTGCATNAVALLSAPTATLPAGQLAGHATTTVNVAVSMGDSTTVDQSACAGAPLTINYSVS